MEKQKFETLYKEHANAVYKYLFCLTHNADLAEELTQETFYQAMKSIDRFRGDCKLSVWLCQIAKRLWYKELWRHQKAPVSLSDTTESPTTLNDLEHDYLLHVEKVELFRLLHHLDAATREVMYLRLAGELSFAEIGSIMEKTETWARVTFYRGKQKLLKGQKPWNND